MPQPVEDTGSLDKRALPGAEGLILLAVDFYAAMEDGLPSRHCIRLVPIKKAMSENTDLPMRALALKVLQHVLPNCLL